MKVIVLPRVMLIGLMALNAGTVRSGERGNSPVLTGARIKSDTLSAKRRKDLCS